jgi:hypothetical protein
MILDRNTASRSIEQSGALARGIMAGAGENTVHVCGVFPDGSGPSLCDGVLARREPCIGAHSGESLSSHIDEPE